VERCLAGEAVVSKATSSGMSLFVPALYVVNDRSGSASDGKPPRTVRFVRANVDITEKEDVILAKKITE
jgi:hypothetical protein